MPQAIDLKDDRLNWIGAISVEHTPEYVHAWRLPYQEKSLFFDGLVERASTGAGIRLAFKSDATQVNATLATEGCDGVLDLVVDGALVETRKLAGCKTLAFDLSSGEKVIELWLPQNGVLQLAGLELNDGASLARYEDTRPKWITYGSSITHCGAAASPTQTWPGVVSFARGLNLTCLGFGGQCHLDTMVARMMRDRPADYLSMCVGINIQGGSSLGPRTFRTSIIGFVKVVREKHPTTPYAIMSPIISPPREEKPNTVGLSLQKMRVEVESAVKALQDMGDEHVHYVDGLDVFGADYVKYLPDELHPDAEGYRLMGQNFARVVAEKYFV